jgi:tetratricopeptide (TPR) repeat protein
MQMSLRNLGGVLSWAHACRRVMGLAHGVVLVLHRPQCTTRMKLMEEPSMKVRFFLVPAFGAPALSRLAAAGLCLASAVGASAQAAALASPQRLPPTTAAVAAPAAESQGNTDNRDAAQSVEPPRASDDADQAGVVLLLAGRYAELDSAVSKQLAAYLAGHVTEEEMAQRFTALSGKASPDANLDAWVQAFPQSYAARLVRGWHLVTMAWLARGNNFASDTTDVQFKSFMEGLQRASKDLMDSRKFFAKPVWSYTGLIKVARGVGMSQAEARQFHDEAVKLDPQAYQPRLEYQLYLTPRWHGNAEQMQTYLREYKSSLLDKPSKDRLESAYWAQMGWDAHQDKRFKEAADDFFKAYGLTPEPRWLYQSGKAALDGNLVSLAMQRWDALVKQHPKYAQGWNMRAWLYESQLKDDVKAIKDYQVAADLGNAYAQNRVGWWYLTGKGVAKDLNRASQWFKLAAAQGNDNAIANLKYIDKLRKHSMLTE